MSKSKFNCGKFCGRRFKGSGAKRFRGFGVATAGQGLRVLHSASIDAEDGHCGPALEKLGKAKVLLGPQTSHSEAKKLIAEVERGCPKSRVIAVRADVVEALRLTPDSALPSTWSASHAALMQGSRLRKPMPKKVLDHKLYARTGKKVYHWRVKPYEQKIYARMLKAREDREWARDQYKGKRGGRPKSRSAEAVSKRIRPSIRRRGETLKRRRGRPKKLR